MKTLEKSVCLTRTMASSQAEAHRALGGTAVTVRYAYSRVPRLKNCLHIVGEVNTTVLGNL